jgi:spermidine synthase
MNLGEHLRIPIRSDKLGLDVHVQALVASVETEFQRIDIVDTDVFGRILLLDGHVQLSSMDERAYHEALVQIPMLNLDRPKHALVVGGGDGGVIRELCRHASIEHVDIAEIDAGVIETCRTFMPELSDGAFDDPRVHLHVTDAFEFVKQAPRKYDLIVVDSTDVYEDEEGALSEQLFTDTFYKDCRAALAEDGIVVTQADNLVFCPYSLEHIASMFGKVFAHVGSYQAIVPSFGGFSGFCYGSNGRKLKERFSELSASTVELRYLNEATYNLALTPLRFA